MASMSNAPKYPTMSGRRRPGRRLRRKSQSAGRMSASGAPTHQMSSYTGTGTYVGGGVKTGPTRGFGAQSSSFQNQPTKRKVRRKRNGFGTGNPYAGNFGRQTPPQRSISS
jgi:TctA family transporter